MASKPSPRPPESGAATLLDVAREANVSASTVSRIINGTAGVKPAKRAAVEAAVRKLDFQLNLSARSLKKGVSMTIGVLTQDVESPFFTRAMVGIEKGLAASGYAPLIASGHWNPKDEAQRLRLLLARRIDGLVILTGHLSDADIVDFARHQPIVVTGRALEAPNVKGLRLDQQLCGYMATRHLLALGHRQIAHIAGPTEQPDAVDRHAGYLRALEDAGLPADPALLVQGDFIERGGLMAMNRLLDSGAPFSAVFCANDQTAVGARMALYRRGVRVPDDISLVGVDDIPAAAYQIPPLTTVRQPTYDIGLQAAQTLLGMLGQASEMAPMPQLELVARETTRRL